MKYIKIASIVLLSSFLSCNTKKQESTEMVQLESSQPIEVESFYDFKVKDINGNDFDFSQLKGKKVLVVNTASECGYTPQYKELQELYEKYGGDKFTIIGFPANNFGGQEPGSNAEIMQFCTQNFNVSFPMMSKISVEGEDQHPVYQFLTQKVKNGQLDSEVKWNFQKYLINSEGKLEKFYYSETSPMDEDIQSWIKK